MLLRWPSKLRFDISWPASGRLPAMNLRSRTQIPTHLYVCFTLQTARFTRDTVSRIIGQRRYSQLDADIAARHWRHSGRKPV